MLHTLLICEYRYCNLQVNGKRVLMLLCWFLACQGTVEIWKAKIEVNTNQENEQEQGQGGEEVDHAVVEPAHLPLLHWAEQSTCKN